MKEREKHRRKKKNIEKKLRIRASAALVQEHDCIALAEPIVLLLLLIYSSLFSHSITIPVISVINHEITILKWMPSPKLDENHADGSRFSGRMFAHV